MNGKNKRWRESRWEERQAERLERMELRRDKRQKRLRHEHIGRTGGAGTGRDQASEGVPELDAGARDVRRRGADVPVRQQG